MGREGVERACLVTRHAPVQYQVNNHCIEDISVIYSVEILFIIFKLDLISVMNFSIVLLFLV